MIAMLLALGTGISGLETAKYDLTAGSIDPDLHILAPEEPGQHGLALTSSVRCTTPSIPIGLAWRPPSAVRVTARLRGELPESLQVAASYSCDGVHYSDWTPLARDSDGAAFTGELHASDGEYSNHRSAWFESGPRWNCDEEEYCRWLAESDPAFFARSIPRIGWVQVQIRVPADTEQASGTLQGFDLEIPWFVGGLHTEPPDGTASLDKKWDFRLTQSESVPPRGETIYECGFDQPQWWQDWTTSGEPDRTQVVEDDPQLGFVRHHGPALRVQVENGGHYGVSLKYPFARHLGREPEEIVFRYRLRLASDWNPETGGKLPGPSGTYNRAGWGGRPVDGTNGWSARGQFFAQKNGSTTVGSYCYHTDMRGQYGSSWAWNRNGHGAIPNDQWVLVEQYLKLNTPGQADGVLRGWIDGQLAFDKTDVRFRTVDALKIECIWLNVYHGGKQPATSDHHLFIDDVEIVLPDPHSS